MLALHDAAVVPILSGEPTGPATADVTSRAVRASAGKESASRGVLGDIEPHDVSKRIPTVIGRSTDPPRSMQVRVARHTAALDAVLSFYRDGLGLIDTGGFEEHEGYSGVFLTIPDTGTHLEFTSGGSSSAPRPDPETLLVLYLGSPAAVTAALARCDAPTVPSRNPYWDRTGASTVVDPDGFRVVLVPDTWPPTGDMRAP